MPRLDSLLQDEDSEIAGDIQRKLHLQGVRTIEALFATEDSLALEAAEWDFLLQCIESSFAAQPHTLLYHAPVVSTSSLSSSLSSSSSSSSSSAIDQTSQKSISVGVRALDAVFSSAGGLARGAITELVGRPATGKTQLCMFCSLKVAETGGTVVYVDGSSSLRAERLYEMAVGNGLRWDEVGSRVRVFEALDIPQLVSVLDVVAAGIEGSESQSPTEAKFWSGVRLLVIDSIGPLLSTIVRTGHGGDATFDRIARQLAVLSSSGNIAVLTVNYSRSGKEGAVIETPGLGSIWKSVPDIQIQVSTDLAPSSAEVENKLRRLTVLKSNQQAIGATTYFCIDSHRGIHDQQ